MGILIPDGVSVFRKDMRGYRVFIYSDDHSNDRHVHVGKGMRSSKWELMLLEIVDPGQFDASELKLQRKLLEEHYAIIILKWEEYWKGMQA